MIQYILRRILLMIPTFLGTTFLVFIILSYVPGGPFDRALMQLKQMQFNGETSSINDATNRVDFFSEEMISDLKKQYGLDKPLITRYLIWLGLYKRTIYEKTLPLSKAFREDIRYVKRPEFIYSIQRWIKVEKEKNILVIYESGVGSDFKFGDEYDELPNVYDIIDWEKSTDWKIKSFDTEKINIVKRKFSGILTLDFGKSYVYDEQVLTLIKKRIHISAYFGILGFILSYMICIPLGIFKALKHGEFFDVLSSIIVFIGYSLPGYVLGALLLVYFGGGSFYDFFPLGGFVSENFSNLPPLKKLFDLLHHTFLPVLCYTISSFATLTVLMKNSFLENISKDFVRFAYAKGLKVKRIVFVHILRNSLIPVATGIGHIIGVFLAGSYFIERVFNIDGIGKLSYMSIMSADYPVIMGFLALNTIILLFGNLISDLVYVLIDPRIRFK